MKFFATILLLAALSVEGATYYIDFKDGVDSNNGTSTGTPWKHHPYMNGATGVSAAYGHSAGDRFIFKGGVTNDSTCFPFNISASGTAGSADYYGTNGAWGTGRAIFDNQYVSSGNNMVDASSRRYINFNGIEFTGLKTPRDPGNAVSRPYNAWMLSLQGNADHITITNCYFHGWVIDKSGGSATPVYDEHHGAVRAYGNGFPIGVGLILANSEFSNLENAPNNWNGEMVYGFETVVGNLFHDNSSLGVCGFTNRYNTVYNICYPYSGYNDDGASLHYNGLMASNDRGDSGQQGGDPGYPHPSDFSYNVIGNQYGGANKIYFRGIFSTAESGGTGGICYIYNNLCYGMQHGQQAIEIGDDNGGATVYVENNTTYVDPTVGDGQCITYVNANYAGTVVIRNNHMINNAAQFIACPASGGVSGDHNLFQSYATATSSGYTAGNNWAPTTGTSPTVNAGSSSVHVTTDILGGARPVGAFDIGAYEFGSSVTNPPSITQQPTAQTNWSGSDISLSVIASGGGTMSYSWQMNSNTIPGATSSSYASNNVQTSFSGWYRCMVTNEVGWTNSDNVYIQITNAPAYIASQPPAAQTNYVGDQLSLSVVGAGSQPLTNQWFLNNTPLAHALNPSATNATYTTNNVQSSQAGTYKVVVGNIYGTATSVDSVITVSAVNRPGVYATYTNALSASANSLTTSVTVGGTNTLLKAWVRKYYSGGGSVSSVTWNGVPMTKYYETNYYTANGTLALWYLLAPTPGVANVTANLVVNTTVAVPELQVTATPMTNAAQTSPFEAAVANYYPQSSPAPGSSTLNAVSTPNDAVEDCVVIASSDWTKDGPQRLLGVFTDASTTRMGASITNAIGSLTQMKWTGPNDAMTHIAVGVKGYPLSGGGGPPPPSSGPGSSYVGHRLKQK